MENLEVILSLACTAFSLLVACVTFIIKLARNIKARLKEEGITALMSAVAPIIEIAETFTNYTGAEKKEYVLTKANQYAIAQDIRYDELAVSEKIEELVEFTKQVNKRI